MPLTQVAGQAFVDAPTSAEAAFRHRNNPDAKITLAGSFADRSPSRERSANEAIGWLTAVPSSIIRNAEPDPRVAGSKPQRQAGHAGLTRGLQFR